jgi:hypothetical protein
METSANRTHHEVMTILVLLAALAVLLLIVVRLARLVMRDGLGSNPPPRSHRAELGTWVDQELQR